MSQGEKLAAKKFMEESYTRLGGKEKGYYSHIALSFLELDNLQKFSELELARNALHPDRSQFLTAPLNSIAAQNGSRMLGDSIDPLQSAAQQNLDMSRDVTRYIAFRKMEKSRQEQMKSMIDTAVSLLNEDDHTTEVRDVKLLLEDNTPKLQLEPIKEETEPKEREPNPKPQAPGKAPKAAPAAKGDKKKPPVEKPAKDTKPAKAPTKPSDKKPAPSVEKKALSASKDKKKPELKPTPPPKPPAAAAKSTEKKKPEPTKGKSAEKKPPPKKK